MSDIRNSHSSADFLSHIDYSGELLKANPTASGTGRTVPGELFVDFTFNRFNGNQYEDQNQAVQDSFGVTASDAESLIFDQTPISLASAVDVAVEKRARLLAADPTADISMSLITSPLSNIEIPVTQEEKLDVLLGRWQLGEDFVGDITSQDQVDLEREIKPDVLTQEVLKEAFLNDLLASINFPVSF